MAQGGNKGIFIASIIGIPAAIVAAVAATLISSNLPPDDATEPSHSVSSPAEPTVPSSSLSPEPGDASGGQAAVADPATLPTEFVPVSVSLSDSVSTQWCKRDGNSGFGWNNGTGTIAGQGHTSGFRCLVGYTPVVGFVDLVVPPDASHFSVVAGQSDDASQVGTLVHFEVLDVVSATPLAQADVPFGAPVQFDVPVDQLVRIRLQVSVDSSQPASTWAAWADPAFR